MKKWLKGMLISLLCLFALWFFGQPLLVMFGVIKYKPPLHQDSSNAVCVALLDTSGSQPVVLGELTGTELNVFMQEFLQFDIYRYVNDPPTDFDDRTIKVCYADGSYDMLGEIVCFYSAEGERLSLKGWYGIPDDVKDYLFDKYLNAN